MSAGDQSSGFDDRDDVLAGEYVLGVLSLETRRQVEDRMASDRAFSQAVHRWQSDLSDFNDDYQEVAPRPAVFAQIERRLFGSVPAAQTPGGLWNSAAFWRWLSLGTSMAAIAALVYATTLVPAQRSSAPLIAELSAPDNAVNILASYDAESGRMRIVPVAAGGPQEKSLELWLVPGSGDPRSLGVFPPSMDGDLVIPADLRDEIGEGTTFAVTLEPFGGSPTGRATGPIVASGTVRRL